MQRGLPRGELHVIDAPRQTDGTVDHNHSPIVDVDVLLGYSCGVYVLMYIEHIATGNGIPRGAHLWSPNEVARRRREYTKMANWDRSVETPVYIETPLFPSKRGLTIDKCWRM